MDTFPALVPTTRVFTVGDVPKKLQTSLSGVAEGYKTGNRRVGQTLSMTFAYLTETQVNLVKTHYFNAKGTYDIFFLSREIWNDYITPPISLIDNYAWRYAAMPTITDVEVNRFTLQVELQTIPINTGDLVIDAELAPASPGRTYILDAGGAGVSHDLKKQTDELRTGGFAQLAEAAQLASTNLGGFNKAMQTFMTLQKEYEKGGISNEQEYSTSASKMATELSGVAKQFGEATVTYASASKEMIAAARMLRSNGVAYVPEAATDLLDSKKSPQ